ncbi:MAG TPA: fibronectin type III domain-containing protein, partial [Actinomycetota bacterium]
GYAADATIERFASPNRVTVTASPVRMTDNDECSPIWPWSCPHQATNDFDGYLDVLATDYGAWADRAQREAMYGMDYTTNVGLTSIPPEIVNDPATGRERLLIRMANHHLYSDATLFEGFAHLRIPNLFLRRAYGVDHPSSLTGSGIDTAGTGSAATVSVMPEPGGGAMLVDIEGMRFSRKRVRISRGVITPTKPKDVRARRTPKRVRLRFTEAKQRGSKITRYRASCVRGGTALTGGAKRSPVVVKGLSPGVKYACRVRAISKAGPGRWSKKVRA